MANLWRREVERRRVGRRHVEIRRVEIRRVEIRRVERWCAEGRRGARRVTVGRDDLLDEDNKS